MGEKIEPTITTSKIGLDYKREYECLRKDFVKLELENQRLRKAVVNLALVLEEK